MLDPAIDKMRKFIVLYKNYTFLLIIDSILGWETRTVKAVGTSH